MPSHNVDTKKGGARITQTHVITRQKQNLNNKIQYTYNRETAMLTLLGNQNKQNNKQKRTFRHVNMLYTAVVHFQKIMLAQSASKT